MSDDNNKGIAYEDTMPVIMRIPKNSVTLDINASFVSNGELAHAHKTLNLDGIIEIRNDFVSLVGDDYYDAVYSLTEKGLEAVKNK